VIILTAEGSAFKYSFDPRRGGECKRETYVRFYKGLTEPPHVPSGLEGIGVSMWNSMGD
jgi:hypothetical protein